MQMAAIASSLGVPVEVAQIVVRPLVGQQLTTRGAQRGTRYYLPEAAPPLEPVVKTAVYLLYSDDTYAKVGADLPASLKVGDLFTLGGKRWGVVSERENLLNAADFSHGHSIRL